MYCDLNNISSLIINYMGYVPGIQLSCIRPEKYGQVTLYLLKGKGSKSGTQQGP